MKYEILTRFVGDSWENVSRLDGEPQYFDSPEEAQVELDSFLADAADMGYDPDDYKIGEVA